MAAEGSPEEIQEVGEEVRLFAIEVVDAGLQELLAVKEAELVALSVGERIQHRRLVREAKIWLSEHGNSGNILEERSPESAIVLLEASVVTQDPQDKEPLSVVAWSLDGVARIIDESLAAGLGLEAALAQALKGLVDNKPGVKSWTTEALDSIVARGLRRLKQSDFEKDESVLLAWYNKCVAQMTAQLDSPDGENWLMNQPSQLSTDQESAEIAGMLLETLLESYLDRHYFGRDKSSEEFGILNESEQIFTIELIGRVPKGQDPCKYTKTCRDINIVGSEACRAHTLSDFLLRLANLQQSESQSDNPLEAISEALGESITHQLADLIALPDEARLKRLLELPRTILSDPQFNQLIALVLRAESGKAECRHLTCTNTVVKHHSDTDHCASHLLLKLFYGEQEEQRVA